MTQCERILVFLQDYGSITQLDAMSQFGCMRLAARIADLRKAGFRIEKEMVTRKNRYGESVSFAQYYLVKQKKGGDYNEALSILRAQ